MRVREPGRPAWTRRNGADVVRTLAVAELIDEAAVAETIDTLAAAGMPEAKYLDAAIEAEAKQAAEDRHHFAELAA